MSFEELVVYLVVAMLCGILGQVLAGRSLGGCFVSMVVGLLGAFVGSFIARALGLPEPLAFTVGDRAIPVLWSVVGAALVTFVVTFMRRRSYDA